MYKQVHVKKLVSYLITQIISLSKIFGILPRLNFLNQFGNHIAKANFIDQFRTYAVLWLDYYYATYVCCCCAKVVSTLVAAIFANVLKKKILRMVIAVIVITMALRLRIYPPISGYILVHIFAISIIHYFPLQRSV